MATPPRTLRGRARYLNPRNGVRESQQGDFPMMRNMLRNSVLVMTAAAALITGVTIAAAQSGGGMTGDRGSHAASSRGGSGTHHGSGMHQRAGMHQAARMHHGPAR